MEQKGELVSFRPDIKVVDCTLRDGGLVNNFEFSEDFVRDLYKANVAAGVDYMEFGYKASKEVFKVEDYGKWKFCDEKDIRAIVGDNDTDLKISVMADADYITQVLLCISIHELFGSRFSKILRIFTILILRIVY